MSSCLSARGSSLIVIDPGAALERDRSSVKNIIDVLDDEPFLPPVVVDLALWVAEYYACGAGDALAAAMPPERAHKTMRIASLTAQGHEPGLVRDLRPGMRGMRMKEAIDVLRGAPAGISVPVLNKRGISSDTLRRLAAGGLVVFGRVRVERDPFANEGQRSAVSRHGPARADRRAARAVEALCASAESGRFGVAAQGDRIGKTEVYLRLTGERAAAWKVCADPHRDRADAGGGLGVSRGVWRSGRRAAQRAVGRESDTISASHSARRCFDCGWHAFSGVRALDQSGQD